MRSRNELRKREKQPKHSDEMRGKKKKSPVGVCKKEKRVDGNWICGAVTVVRIQRGLSVRRILRLPRTLRAAAVPALVEGLVQ